MIVAMERDAFLSSSGSPTAERLSSAIPAPQLLACRDLEKFVEFNFFLLFLSPRPMQGDVLAGVSSSQKPEFVVGSLARICRRSLTRSEKPRTFVESSKFRCKWKFRQCSPVEVGNVPFSESTRGVGLDEGKQGAAGPHSRCHGLSRHRARVWGLDGRFPL